MSARRHNGSVNDFIRQVATENYIRDVFGRTGVLSEKFSAYEVRRGQVELACAVDECFSSKENSSILAEAPTGTGKSLAYAVPATWRASSMGKRTVIVTANIALQEQLVGKDLPLLREVLPWTFTFALAKGLNNYLCRDVFAEAENDLLLRGGKNVLGIELGTKWETVREWARSTQKGDVSELPFELPSELRNFVVTTTDECVGKKCPEYDRCFAMKARQLAKAANLVVTNYHLFFADLAIKISTGGTGGVLPSYDHIVLDEGHETADIARGFFGFRITSDSIRWATRFLSGMKASKRKAALVAIDPQLRAAILHESDRLFARLRALSRSEEYGSRLTSTGQIAAERLCEELDGASRALTLVSESGSLSPERREEVRRASDRCSDIAANLRAADELANEDNAVYFLEPAGSGVALSMKPIEVADVLRTHLFGSDKHRGIIVTSATLSTGGRSGFDHIVGEIGADEADELEVESPFDFEENSILVVPRDVPLPIGKEGRDFPDAVAGQLEAVSRRSGGRVLALFTSYRVLEVAHRHMLGANLPFRIYRQGEAPRMQLVEEFKRDETSVLLGTDSFWQGIDVPGRSLSVVFIDKLPFETPDDPVLSAISDRDPKWFKRYSLPRAVIKFKQGVGRLIRTSTDRGAIFVCDRRLVEKPYGRMFTRALPEMRISRQLEDISDRL